MIQELIDRAKTLKKSERLNYEKISELLGVSSSNARETGIYLRFLVICLQIRRCLSITHSHP